MIERSPLFPAALYRPDHPGNHRRPGGEIRHRPGRCGILRLHGLYNPVAAALCHALYYRHCRKKIAETRALSLNVQRQLGELSDKGGTSNLALVVICIPAFFAVMDILAAIAIPAYMADTTKARVASAVSVGRQAADSVADYNSLCQEIPDSLEQTGFVAAIPAAVMSLDLNSQDGTVTVTMANSPLDGKFLQFTPSLESGDQIVWKCTSRDIQDQYLPQQCRQQE